VQVVATTLMPPGTAANVGREKSRPEKSYPGETQEAKK
jgi:hypothetical protein